MTKTEKGNGQQESAITQGKVTQIKGNLITITDNKGVERQIELNSAAGIRIGRRSLV
jgi:hypothetical protein